MSDFWGNVFKPAPRSATGQITGSRVDAVFTQQPWWQDPPGSPEPVSHPVLGPTGQLTSEQVARAAQAEGHNVSRAQHLKNEDNCPGCGGGDYMSPPGSTRRRCFDCGYPIVQQGSGVTISTNSGTPARQVASGGKVTRNYHPEVIEDRIS